MHAEYTTGQIHPQSPVPANPVISSIIADAETLLEASYGERWPPAGVLHIGAEAVLRCTNDQEITNSECPEVLLDVSLDRVELHSEAGSHVLFRAWLRCEPSVEIVHTSVEPVITLAWMVEEFMDDAWIGVLQRLADAARMPLRKPGTYR